MSEHERVGWALYNELVETRNRERLHQMSVIDELKSLLRRACEAGATEDCWYDHNGGCQAHGFLSEPCPYPLIRQYLACPARGGWDGGDVSEVEVRELWAIRWPDGSISGAMYSEDGSDHAEQMIRSAGIGEEIVHRTETITRTDWAPAPSSSPVPPAPGGGGE